MLILDLRWAIIKLGLVGPLMQVTRTVGGEVCDTLPYIHIRSQLTIVLTQLQRQATDKLRQHFANPELSRPIEMRPMDSASHGGFEDEDSRELRRQRTEPL